MLNCGLGLVMMLAAAVFVLVKAEAVRGAIAQIAENAPAVVPALPVFGLGAVVLLAALNPISAPSVSLEGRTLWLLQSLPVASADVLTAKLRLHLYLCAGPTLICAAALAFILHVGYAVGLYMAVLSLLTTMLFAMLGLILNLKRPSLNWTNEAVPIKQSMPVFVVIFGGWLFAALVVGAYFLLRKFCSTETYMIGCIVLFALLCRLLRAWLMRRGAEIFAAL
jgi:ABC-2 type transport system permease protein